jgi:nicotinamidase-related amidase
METPDVNLLIIDPQNDFYLNPPDAIGALPVPGSDRDITNIVKMLNKLKQPTKIYVSLDTHTRNHIANASLWKIVDIENMSEDNKKKFIGKSPPSCTSVAHELSESQTTNESATIQEVADGMVEKWIGTPFSETVLTEEQKPLLKQKLVIEPNFEKIGSLTRNEKDVLTKWFEYYYEEVTKKNGLTLWADHCIEETRGHDVVHELKSKLDVFENVEYHIKGQNFLTEMFSIMKADVVYDSLDPRIMREFSQNEREVLDKYAYTGSVGTGLFKDLPKTDTSLIKNRKSDVPDHVYLKTGFNAQLFEKLCEEGRPIVICGEALTHCVLNSFVDIITELEKKNKTNEIWLIANASSPIPGTEKPAIQKYKANVLDKSGSLKTFIKFKKINDEGELEALLSFEEFLSISGLQKSTGGKRQTRRVKLFSKHASKRKNKKIIKSKTNKQFKMLFARVNKKYTRAKH